MVRGLHSGINPNDRISTSILKLRGQVYQKLIRKLHMKTKNVSTNPNASMEMSSVRSSKWDKDKDLELQRSVHALRLRARDGWLRPTLQELAAERAVLFYETAAEATPALATLSGLVVCVGQRELAGSPGIVRCSRYGSCVRSNLRRVTL